MILVESRQYSVSIFEKDDNLGGILRYGIPAKGKRVVVIGGGDTGADCVGVAHPQGAVINRLGNPRGPQSCLLYGYLSDKQYNLPADHLKVDINRQGTGFERGLLEF